MPTSPVGAQLNIANGIREFAVASPEVVAVVDGERSLGYAELDDRASRLANLLIEHGLAPGERVAIMLGNRLEFCEIACGIAKAGLVSVPINPRLTADEVAYILEHSEARALVLEAALRPAAHGAVDELRIAHVLTLDDDYEARLAPS